MVQRKVQVTVYDQESEDDDGIPEKLQDAILWLNEKVGEIPEQYRSEAFLDLDWNQDDGYLTKIFYQRPETDEEIADRLSKQEAYTAEQWDSEKHTLRSLIEKYPDLAEAMVKQIKENQR